MMPKVSGLDLLKAAKTIAPETEVILMTAYGTVAASLTVEQFSTEGLVAADRATVDARFKELHEFVRL